MRPQLSLCVVLVSVFCSALSSDKSVAQPAPLPARVFTPKATIYERKDKPDNVLNEELFSEYKEYVHRGVEKALDAGRLGNGVIISRLGESIKIDDILIGAGSIDFGAAVANSPEGGGGGGTVTYTLSNGASTFLIGFNGSTQRKSVATRLVPQGGTVAGEDTAFGTSLLNPGAETQSFTAIYQRALIDGAWKSQRPASSFSDYGGSFGRQIQELISDLTARDVDSLNEIIKGIARELGSEANVTRLRAQFRLDNAELKETGPEVRKIDRDTNIERRNRNRENLRKSVDSESVAFALLRAVVVKKPAKDAEVEQTVTKLIDASPTTGRFRLSAFARSTFAPLDFEGNDPTTGAPAGARLQRSGGVIALSLGTQILFGGGNIKDVNLQFGIELGYTHRWLTGDVSVGRNTDFRLSNFGTRSSSFGGFEGTLFLAVNERFRPYVRFTAISGSGGEIPGFTGAQLVVGADVIAVRF